MKQILIQNATIVNEDVIYTGSLLIKDGLIDRIITDPNQPLPEHDLCIDATGSYLIPGVIDEHVHFRDPGLTQKADITTESHAAAAGGVTSIMDMPNTLPQTTTLEAWDDKMKLMAQKSIVNYSCYFGATNTNYTQFPKLDPTRVCGIKVFMGSSTGNMLVDRMESLRRIFGESPLLIATHCEETSIIQENTRKYKDMYGDDVPLECHPMIRSEEACYHSTQLAISLARETGARLHVMHLSTGRELELFQSGATAGKNITAEACVSHLLFTDADYKTRGARIKCNPAVKTEHDRTMLREAVKTGIIDAIATDHAPHLLSDKQGGALKAASGMPMIQYSLVSMLQLVDEGIFTLQDVVRKMCHAPADIYRIDGRGYIREGYKADLVLVRPNHPWTVTSYGIYSKCKWSPVEGMQYNWQVEYTFVNGHLAYQQGVVDETCWGEALTFRP